MGSHFFDVDAESNPWLKVRFLPGSPLLDIRLVVARAEVISHTASSFHLAVPWSIPSGRAYQTWRMP
jgi:hypothetical protein